MDKRLIKISIKELWIEDNTYDGKTRKQWENRQVNSYAPVMSYLLVMLRDKTNNYLVRSDKK